MSVLKNKMVGLCGLALLMAGTALVSARSVFAAPSSTPEEVLDTVVGNTIDGSVDIFTYVLQNYLKYILVFGVAISLYYAFKKFAHIGSR